MERNENYTPVSCDFIDQIEIVAMQGEMVSISYFEQAKVKTVEDKVKTWFTKDKVEYLETINGLIIRLDEVIEVNGKGNSGSCCAV